MGETLEDGVGVGDVDEFTAAWSGVVAYFVTFKLLSWAPLGMPSWRLITGVPKSARAEGCSHGPRGYLSGLHGLSNFRYLGG